MKILKRNNSTVDFNPKKIHDRVKKQADGLKVNVDQLFIKVTSGIADLMTTKQIDDLIAVTSESLSYLHPDYSKLAGNICISRHHKETEESFIKMIKKLNNQGIINNNYYELVKANIDIIQENIDYSRDYMFDYFAWNRLKSIYLIKNDTEIIERPQHMYMRVALTTNKTIEEAMVYYHLLSTHMISPATPIMINAGTIIGQLASCNLNLVKGDNTDDLLKTFNNICISSSKAEGIGLAVHNIRSKKSFVGKEGGLAGGILKYLKIVNEGLRFWNQRGKRAGSCAVYIETWHKDIVDILEIKLPNGKDEQRARDLFTALWVNDLFMKSVKEDLDWYLFCPSDIEKAGLKPFHEIYGKEFEDEYQKAVDLGFGDKVRAKEIWLKILESQIECGVPYILNKDSCNLKSNHKNIGTIKSSNLCAEIVQYTDSQTTAICTLSSIPVQKYYDMVTKTFDYKKLYNNVYKVTKSLNQVIDINNYSTLEGEKGGKEQRAIAIGVQGLADLFAMMDIPFICETSIKVNKEIFETIYFAALSASNDLAKETGLTYHYYEGSPISQGIFQFNMWGVESSELSGLCNWEQLKESILQYGVRNSLVTACMPTASSASVINSNEAFEPFNSNIYVRGVLGGEYAVVNKHMVRDLENEGLWNDYLAKEIVAKNGTIQDIPVIPDNIKEKYKTVYELPQSKLISMSADRALFIDQSQSLNIFIANPTVGKLTSSHFKAWELGLKTGMYYLRSKPVEFKGKHLGVDNSKQLKTNETETSSNSSQFDCDGCGA
jgi:ribonucleoside-diphosphate reductase alpha subunit